MNAGSVSLRRTSFNYENNLYLEKKQEFPTCLLFIITGDNRLKMNNHACLQVKYVKSNV